MDNERLVELVFERKPLWLKADKSFHIRDKTKKLWEEVAAEMGATELACKTRWRGLRDVFRREHKKLINRRNCLANPSKPPTSSWMLFDKLLFLQEQITSSDSNDTAPEDNLIEDEGSIEYGMETKYDPIHSIFTTNYDGEFVEHTITKPAMELIPMKTKNDTLIEEHVINLDGKVVQVEKAASFDEDSDYLFLVSLLPYLQAIPQHRKMVIRSKIQQIFIDDAQEQTSCTEYVITQ